MSRARRGPRSASPSPLVGVIMGSTSDLTVMQGAIDILQQFAVAHEVDIVSAHRTPQRMVDYATGAAPRGLRIIIAGAGGAAHLPGMTASLTPLPVIGVPVAATALNGADALLSIAQMPAGIPVATVAINNATNAGLLAVQILALDDPALARSLVRYRESLAQKVLTAASTLRAGKSRPKSPRPRTR